MVRRDDLIVSSEFGSDNFCSWWLLANQTPGFDYNRLFDRLQSTGWNEDIALPKTRARLHLVNGSFPLTSRKQIESLLDSQDLEVFHLTLVDNHFHEISDHQKQCMRRCVRAGFVVPPGYTEYVIHRRPTEIAITPPLTLIHKHQIEYCYYLTDEEHAFLQLSGYQFLPVRKPKAITSHSDFVEDDSKFILDINDAISRHSEFS